MKKLFAVATALFVLVTLLAGCAASGKAPGETLSSDQQFSSSAEEPLEAPAPELPEPPEPPEPTSKEDPAQKKGIFLSTEAVRPGGFITVLAYGADSEIRYLDMFGVERTFEPAGEAGISFIPVRARTEPGTYSLSIIGGGLEYSGDITVLPRQFDLQTLEVDADMATSTYENEQANNEYYQALNHLKFEDVPEQLWEGNFICPIAGGYNVSTTFGLIRTRISPNGTSETRHVALDLACAEGTAVGASNAGKVLFSGMLQLSGNTVLIEHGFGLKTWYYHMSKLEVETGDFVKRGEKIGEVGSTGFSTGPHLHFEASIYDISIDPDILIAETPNLGEK